MALVGGAPTGDRGALQELSIPSKVASGVGSLGPMEMCPASEPASRRMGFQTEIPRPWAVSPHLEQEVPRLSRRRLGCPRETLLALSIASMALRGKPRVPVGVAHLPGPGSATGHRLPFTFTANPGVQVAPRKGSGVFISKAPLEINFNRAGVGHSSSC